MTAVPLEGFEPSRLPPEGSALSPELGPVNYPDRGSCGGSLGYTGTVWSAVTGRARTGIGCRAPVGADCSMMAAIEYSANRASARRSVDVRGAGPAGNAARPPARGWRSPCAETGSGNLDGRRLPPKWAHRPRCGDEWRSVVPRLRHDRCLEHCRTEPAHSRAAPRRPLRGDQHASNRAQYLAHPGLSPGRDRSRSRSMKIVPKPRANRPIIGQSTTSCLAMPGRGNVAARARLSIQEM